MPMFEGEKQGDLVSIVLGGMVADEVKNGYNQIFGAGIMVPPKELIVG